MEGAENILIEHNTVTGSVDGSIRDHGSRFTVRGNVISNTWKEGINIWSETGMVIHGNTIAGVNKNATGISIGEPDAVISGNKVSNATLGMRSGKGQTFENNRIFDCTTGMEIGWNDTVTCGNTISEYEVGIDLTGDSHTVTENTLSNCDVGIKACGSTNLFHHNNFIGTTASAVDNGENLWDSGPIIGGNYWWMHECTGNPSDGSSPYHTSAQGTPQFDAEIAEKGHLWMDTN